MTRFERRSILGLALGVIACVVLIVVIAVGGSIANTNTARIGALAAENHALAKRIATDEHQTCVIQRRGLPAGHALAASMADIHALLTQKPHTRAERAQARRTPHRIRMIVRDLNRHLAKYLRLESLQPKTRSCTLGGQT